MKKNIYIPLTNRALLKISGVDARTFLQSIITNDINKLSESQALYTLMLTPQGKVLYDFFIYEIADRIFIDCNASKIKEIKDKLEQYKLRLRVKIEDVSNELEVIALIANVTKLAELPIIFTDPRSYILPVRVIEQKAVEYKNMDKLGFILGNIEEYEKLRINICMPSDLEIEDAFPLEYEMDKYNAIDYEKGCYVGQEVTARTHYRGKIRKKPFLVRAKAGVDLSEYIKKDITSGGNKVGVLRSAVENQGIALINTEELQKSTGELMVGWIMLFLSS